MNFSLKQIQFSDWKILLEWRNDNNTRHHFFDNSIINETSHKEYVKNICKTKNQYIFYINDTPVGTIKFDNKNNESYLSYTISNKFRGKNLSVIMMHLFLYNKSGIFICEIKDTNVASIKMVERIGYKLQKIKNNVLTYKLIK